MSITVNCECGTEFRAKDEAAGRQVKCPKCSAIVEVSSRSSFDDDPLGSYQSGDALLQPTEPVAPSSPHPPTSSGASKQLPAPSYAAPASPPPGAVNSAGGAKREKLSGEEVAIIVLCCLAIIRGAVGLIVYTSVVFEEPERFLTVIASLGFLVSGIAMLMKVDWGFLVGLIASFVDIAAAAVVIIIWAVINLFLEVADTNERLVLNFPLLIIFLIPAGYYQIMWRRHNR